MIFLALRDRDGLEAIQIGPSQSDGKLMARRFLEEIRTCREVTTGVPMKAVACAMAITARIRERNLFMVVYILV